MLTCVLESALSSQDDTKCFSTCATSFVALVFLFSLFQFRWSIQKIRCNFHQFCVLIDMVSYKAPLFPIVKRCSLWEKKSLVEAFVITERWICCLFLHKEKKVTNKRLQEAILEYYLNVFLTHFLTIFFIGDLSYLFWRSNFSMNFVVTWLLPMLVFSMWKDHCCPLVQKPP